MRSGMNKYLPAPQPPLKTYNFSLNAGLGEKRSFNKTKIN